MTEILLIITAIIALFTIGYVIGHFTAKVNGHHGQGDETSNQEEAVTVSEPSDIQEFVIGDIYEVVAPAREKPVCFAKRILDGETQNKEFFVAIYDEFTSLRGVNIRISAKGVSYRLGRELIAKSYVRGKTLRLNLALAVEDYPQNVYFQKDMSDVKIYQEVPFGVKIKSGRGLKNAIKLIGELAENRAIAKKLRYVKKDALVEVEKAVK